MTDSKNDIVPLKPQELDTLRQSSSQEKILGRFCCFVCASTSAAAIEWRISTVAFGRTARMFRFFCLDCSCKYEINVETGHFDPSY